MIGKSEKHEALFFSLKKIIQAIDLHSKQLSAKYGVTGPQVLLLKTIQKAENKEISSKALANKVSLSQATVTSIIDRLSEKKYVKRSKVATDKRKTMLKLTKKAVALLEKNPSILQEEFVAKFSMLEDWDQALMLASIEKMASLMSTKMSYISI